MSVSNLTQRESKKQWSGSITVAYSLFVHTATTNTPEHVMKASNPIPLPVKKLQKTHNQGLASSKLPPNNTYIKKKIHSIQFSGGPIFTM